MPPQPAETAIEGYSIAYVNHPAVIGQFDNLQLTVSFR
jgi:hypothetical protein